MALGTSIVNKSSKKLAPKKPAQRNKPAAEAVSQPQPATPQAETQSLPRQEPITEQPSETYADDIHNDRPTKRRRVEPTDAEDLAPPVVTNTATIPDVQSADEPQNALDSQLPPSDSVPLVNNTPATESRETPLPDTQRDDELPLPTPEPTQAQANDHVNPGDIAVEKASTGNIANVSHEAQQRPAQDAPASGLLTPPQTQNEVSPNEGTDEALDSRSRNDQPSLFLPSDDTMLEDAQALLALRTAHANGFAETPNRETSQAEEQADLPETEVQVVSSGSRRQSAAKPRQPRTPKEPGKPKKPRQSRKKAEAGGEGENAEAGAKKPRKKRQPKSQAVVQSTEDADVAANGVEGESGDMGSTVANEAPIAPMAPMGSIDNGDSGDVDENGTPMPDNDAEDEPTTKTSKRKGRRRRAETPEDAEDQEINPTEVSMFELTRDVQVGKVSNREREFRKINWVEVAQRRKQAEEEARARAIAGQTGNGEDDDEERRRVAEEEERRREVVGATRGPQLRLVNGQMILDTESLVVTNRATADDRGGGAAEEESDLTKRINSHSWLYDNRREPTERFASTFKSDPWTDEQTDAFYDALRMFGTDFYIISKMFPGKTRRHIKLKFVREERLDPDRVKSALIGEVVEMDMGVYCAATGMEESQFKDPKVLEEELRVESEQQREEIEKQRDEAADAARKKQEAAQEKSKRAKKTRKKKGLEYGGGGGGDPEIDLGEVAR